MNRNRELAINMVAQITAVFTNMSITFFLTSFIVNRVGSEAYGFVGLANNFINYAELLTVALNSMAGRFITIKIHRNDILGANKYFTSVVFANAITALFMTIPFMLIVLNLDKILNISSDINWDVKLLWTFIFLNFIISIIFGTYGIATFVRNKLYLDSIRNIISQFIKIFILIFSFYFFVPSVWYLGVASLGVTIYTVVWNVYCTKRILPEIEVKKIYFELRAVFEIISSGIWNSIIKLSQILTSSLDLLIANLFISSTAMGIMAISKTVPMAIITLIVAISSLFSPSMTIAYARNDNRDMVNQIQQSMRIMTIFTVIPNSILICFGSAFYKLWIPGEDTNMIQILSILTVINSVISGAIQPLYNIFTITNKVKQNAIIMVIFAVLSTLTTFIVLKFTDFGIYAIPGVSLIFALILPFVFHIPFAAKYLDQPWNSFYHGAFKSLFSFVLLVILGMIMNKLININSWIELIFSTMLFSIVAFIILFLTILQASERNLLINRIKKLRN